MEELANGIGAVLLDGVVEEVVEGLGVEMGNWRNACEGEQCWMEVGELDLGAGMTWLDVGACNDEGDT